ncbi:NADP-dependent oxidoreductase [Subtercola lobariae]|uniref:Oxidoreductase n=1 Tax=Subtercola lobariae TaxID=1588641 RepID=A0A917EY21_9MICO|nr:NADP-dependent oxidoreductase [Subtercola lobariae]GGF31028.1 putative oxidoreductase [Subtercola lobariae]
MNSLGGVEVLTVAEVPVVKPGAGEVLVRVIAAGTNPGELSIREGALESRFVSKLPQGQGSDFAGIVVAVGADGPEGAARFSVGDEVIGWSEKRSSQADYVLVPDTQLILKPEAISWPVAGSLFVASVTAFAAVRAVGAGPGDTVVVSSAAGGVGSIAVQLLKSKGANVIALASPANHEWLASVDATPVDYAGDDLAGRIHTAAPGGVDALIDTHGPEYVDLGIELGIAPERIDTVIAFEAANRVGAKTEGSSTASTAEVLGEMAALVADGSIDVPIAATFPLDEVQAAYTELAKRHTRGKIVLLT